MKEAVESDARSAAPSREFREGFGRWLGTPASDRTNRDDGQAELGPDAQADMLGGRGDDPG